MDWQDSGASPLKPLTDAELVEAMARLDTEAAMALLEEQTELRRLAKLQEDQLRAQEELFEKARLDAEAEYELEHQSEVEPETTEDSQAAQPEHVEELSFDELLGIVDEPIREVELQVEQPIAAPTAAAVEPVEDIAASLNALYGVQSVKATPVASAEENITADEEQPDQLSSLVDDLILQVGGESDEAVLEPAGKPRKEEKPAKLKRPKGDGRSAWSLIANWNGSGALIVAVACGFSFGSFNASLGSLLIAGFAAFVILGLVFAFSALAARRGKSLQQVLARAVFGVTGNVIPTAVLIVARLVGLAIALMSGALAVNVLVPQLGLTGNYSVSLANFSFVLPSSILLAMAILAVATGLAWIRGRAIEVSRMVLAAVTGALLVAILVYAEITGEVSYRADLSFSLTQALQLASLLVVTFGLLFSTSSADENRRIRSTTLIPKFLAAGIVNWLLAGLTALIAGYALATFDIQGPALVVIAIVLVVLGLFSLSTMLAHTSNLLVGLRLREPRWLVRVLISLLVAVLGIWLYLTFDATTVWLSMIQVLPIAGVPVAAWLGIFTCDVMLRRTDYHLVSLDKNYGFYRGWNIANLLGWVGSSAIGLGLVTSNVALLSWVGFLAKPLALSEQLLTANLGIWVSLVLGLLVPLLSGIPRIRRQEAETLAIEARKHSLVDVVGEPEL